MDISLFLGAEYSWTNILNSTHRRRQLPVLRVQVPVGQRPLGQRVQQRLLILGRRERNVRVARLVQSLHLVHLHVVARRRPHGRVNVGAVRALVRQGDAEGDHLLLAARELVVCSGVVLIYKRGEMERWQREAGELRTGRKQRTDRDTFKNKLSFCTCYYCVKLRLLTIQLTGLL